MKNLLKYVSKLLLLISILTASTIYAGGPINAPQGTNYVRPNLSGGYSFYNNNRYMGRALPNNVGNYNYYDRSGVMYSRGREIFKGQYRFNYYRR